MTPSLLALGDSYTLGEGLAPDAAWPAQLQARLRGDGIVLDAVRIVARTGWTAGELAAAMDAATFDAPYALVTLLIGVNDQYRALPIAGYRAQFRALLQRAVELASDAAHIVVVSIPDWGVTAFARKQARDPAAVARAIDAFNAVARREAAAVGAHWVDVTAISRSPEAREECVADGLHPSRAQYARWVEAILPAARDALRGG